MGAPPPPPPPPPPPHSKLHRAKKYKKIRDLELLVRLEHLGREARELKHFLEGDPVEFARHCGNSRIGRVDAVDVGVDVAEFRPKTAANATAVVSDPPCPSVVTRPSGLIPWKPAATAAFMSSPNFCLMLSVGISSMRAARWAEVVLRGICQPCQLRAGIPISWSCSAISPAVTFSPEETSASYSRASLSDDIPST